LSFDVTDHQHLAKLDSMPRVLVWRGEGETQAFKQSLGAVISVLEHGEQVAHLVVHKKLGNHHLDSLAREAATPPIIAASIASAR